MKILHVIGGFTWSYGGSARVVYDISRKLAEKNHEVTIFTTDLGLNSSNTANHIHFQEHDVEVRYFQCLNHWLAHKMNLIISPQMHSELKKEVKNFDLVHLHNFRGIPNYYVWSEARKAHVPYILQADGSTPLIIGEQGPLTTFSKMLYDTLIGCKIFKNADKLIAISQEEKKQYLDLLANNDKISLIYMGLDIGFFENLPDKGMFKNKYNLNRKIILYLGRIHSSKGIEYLIKAFHSLREESEDLTLVIIGPDDGYKATLLKLRSKLNLEDDVLFLDFIDEKDKLGAYVDAEVFIHTVMYMGGVGITPLESILCGTPVIVTDECGEVIKEADCGYLVRYGDVYDLLNKIKHVLGNTKEANKKVLNGQEYIKNNLGYDQVVNKFEKLYRELL